ncbi:MAG: 16S rRNA (adenine(1518)-N(6)/adenine(1519)-N(6))-dimethyltransferase RsmA [Candidatus Methanomethylicia archaeon]|nr:16S rRNA (adenine(1518)-N(6)/adenine(1519)-N(6))-dimethyltransferase RsmA [Candidatus Methanomethylicia archaeon]MCX8169245.1 16S rRNA (adenine(1518)-N(6)/adenine(1519)-N(6))-dimethyltransferase RsmA [Candidatus Methanomethylicia archaeon]MDW7988973.1 16S rRNA (adenine(1518)-N(6)/adenine(1519)-N(6))-dimethyltransferase RsmA [Nitrososphaerota archaeon]
MSLLNEVKVILKQYNIKPRKRLGQNFMISLKSIMNMIEFAKISKEEVVLEIGAGLGLLTKRIAERARKVIAIEIDRKLLRVLEDVLKDFDNVEIIHADILKFKITEEIDKIVSNVPFNISSPLLFKLAKENFFKEAILTFQKEFVDRMLAEPGSADYGRLSVTSRFFFDIEFLGVIPRSCFYPPPEVDTSIIKLIPRRKYPQSPVDDIFLTLTQFIFNRKNRKLKNTLLKFFEVQKMPINIQNEILSKITFLDTRVIDLNMYDIYNVALQIYNSYYKNNSRNIML